MGYFKSNEEQDDEQKGKEVGRQDSDRRSLDQSSTVCKARDAIE